MASHAEIVRAMLVGQKIVVMPAIEGRLVPYDQPRDRGLVPCLASKISDDYDELVAIIDVAGQNFGKPMRSGKAWVHPGIRVIIRSLSFPLGYALGVRIAAVLDAFTTATVQVEEETDKGPVSVNHYVQSILRTSGLVYLGEQVGTKREQWSIDARVSMQDTQSFLG